MRCSRISPRSPSRLPCVQAAHRTHPAVVAIPFHLSSNAADSVPTKRGESDGQGRNRARRAQCRSLRRMHRRGGSERGGPGGKRPAFFTSGAGICNGLARAGEGGEIFLLSAYCGRGAWNYLREGIGRTVRGREISVVWHVERPRLAGCGWGLGVKGCRSMDVFLCQ